MVYSLYLKNSFIWTQKKPAKPASFYFSVWYQNMRNPRNPARTIMRIGSIFSL